jgi:hypothetical protein
MENVVTATFQTDQRVKPGRICLKSVEIAGFKCYRARETVGTFENGFTWYNPVVVRNPSNLTSDTKHYRTQWLRKKHNH